jgi:uncharacterized iron-regulated membrane protein
MTGTLDLTSADRQRLTETEPDVFSPGESDNARQAKLWRAAWRWHFYAAGIVMPILLVLSVTGLAVLLKPTLERSFYGDRLYVDPGGKTERLPYESQRAAVLARHPGATVRSVVPPRDRSRSTQFDLTVSDGKALGSYRDQTLVSTYINPYTGTVLGDIKGSTRLDNFMSDLHGNLLLNRWGDWVVEIGTGWTLVMMTTGVFLWWPRKAKGQGFRRAFRIRLRAQGRKRWRDLHSVPGAVFASVIIFMVVTGLPWSQFWGDRWSRMTEWVGSGENAIETPVSKQAAADLQTDGFKVAWASQREPVPLSRAAGQHDHGGGGGEEEAGRVPLSLDAVEGIARDIRMHPGYAVGMPDGETGVYALSNSWPDRAQVARTAFVDQYTGEVLANHGWPDQGLLRQLTSWGIITHMGRQYGPLNAAVMGGACLAIIWATITAPVMFWKRRPKGKIGTPRRPIDPRLPRRALLIAVVLGLLYPLLGVSMLVVAAFDRFVVRNVPPLRRAFGMP